MPRIMYPRSILLSEDIVVQNGRHPFEVGNHAFNLAGPLARGFAAEFPQATKPAA
jgi:hypothetical protein